MFINKLPFLVSVSDTIGFTTVESLNDRTASSLLKGVKNLVTVYKFRELKVVQMNMDNEFSPLAHELLGIGIHLNTAAANEHVYFLPKR